jgi:hypothetical protein
MSDKDRSFGREACGGDAAAYALSALDPAEAEAFERHRQECDLCAEDLDGFAHVVDALAMSAPQYEAPPALRGRVIDAARSEPRETPASREIERRPSVSMARITRAGIRRPARRPAFATALAVGLASAVLAIVTLTSGGATNARIVNARVAGASGSAQLRVTDGRAELIVRHFPAPAAGRIYEVWLKRPGRTLQPTRVLFSVSDQGAGDIGVPGGLQGVAELLVTEEPAGGSTTPTQPPVIVAPLT